MANMNLTKASIDALESVQDLISIDFNNGKQNAEYITVKPDGVQRITFWTNTWDADSIIDLTSYIAECVGGSASWESLRHYDDSMAECGADEEHLRAYVKDSYINGKDKLNEVFETAVKGCTYTQSMLDKIESFDYEKTSARLYKGMYVTPCMLEVVADEYLKAKEIKHNKATCTSMVEKFLNGELIEV